MIRGFSSPFSGRQYATPRPELKRGPSRPPFSLVQAVHPESLACHRIDGHGGPAEPRGGVENPVHHEDASPELTLGLRPEVPGCPAPGNFQLVHIGGVDLVQRGVPLSGQIATVGQPLARIPRFLGGEFLGSKRQKPDECRQ